MPNLRKTKLCPRFVQGRCTAGGDCKYAHSEQELRATVDFYKTSLCSEWALNGQCARGEVCRYAHGTHELRAPGGGNPAPSAVAAAAAKLAVPVSPAPAGPTTDSAVLTPSASATPAPPTPTACSSGSLAFSGCPQWEHHRPEGVGALTGIPPHITPPIRPPPAAPPTLPAPMREGPLNTRSAPPMNLPLAHLTAGNESASQLASSPPPGYFVRPESSASLAGHSLPSAPPAAPPSPWPSAFAVPTWPPPPPRSAPVLNEAALQDMAPPGPSRSGSSHQVTPGLGSNSSVNVLPGLPVPSSSLEPPQIGLAADHSLWHSQHAHSCPAPGGGAECDGVNDLVLHGEPLGDLQGGVDNSCSRQALAVGPIGKSRSSANTIRAIGEGGANHTDSGGGRDPLSPWHVLPLTRLPVTPEKLQPDDPTTDEGDSASDGSDSMTHRSRPMSSFRTPPGLSLDGKRPSS